MSGRTTDGWSLKALVAAATSLFSAGILMILLPLIWQAPDAIVVLCFLLSPPLFLMAIVLLGRLALENAWSGEDSKELDRLLERKRGGALKQHPGSFWKSPNQKTKAAPLSAKIPVPPALAQHVQPAPAKPQATIVAQVLDHLVDWKRHQARTGQG